MSYEKKKLPDEEIIKMYKDGASLYKIAKIYNVSHTAIQGRLKKHNIKLRNLSECKIGDKNPMYGQTHTKEVKAKLRALNKKQFADPLARQKHGIITAKQIANGQTGKSKNNLETKFAKILDSLKIEYVWGFVLDRFCFDFYLPKLNMLIECDGTFWHADPRFYRNKELSKIQKKNLVNDKIKSQLALSCGFDLVRFWEEDIENHVDEVIGRLKSLI